MRLFFALCISYWLSMVASCGGGSDSAFQTNVSLSKVEELWGVTIQRYLESELWVSENNYDAGHVLMLPLHWSFKTDEGASYVSEFEDYFARYSSGVGISGETNRLRKLQYLYLHSQYLKLAANRGEWGDIQDALYDEILAVLLNEWFEAEAVNYGGLRFDGMRDRLRVKLNAVDMIPEYAKAVFDEEFFGLAILSDLYSIDKRNVPEVFAEILQLGYEVYLLEGVEVGDGWLFQPGVWSDYPDYRYAGHDFIAPDLDEFIIEDIATDSSHFHRMPLWLLSMRDAYSEGRHEWLFFDALYTRLQRQFEDVMYTAASLEFPAPRISNYTDGRNGIYRYEYDTVGSDSGYGPYQLSAVTLPLGWYVFLGSGQLIEDYSALPFPLPEEVIALYVGPNTTRTRHPLVRWPDYFTNGFAELHVLMAITLSQEVNK